MATVIRPFRPEDAPALAQVIRRALYETNAKDYPVSVLDFMTDLYQPPHILDLAAQGSIYVAEADARPVGCGAVTPHAEHPEDGYIQAVFLDPDYQGQGLGRAILEAVEADPLFRSRRRVEVHSSLTARVFYEKMGYRHASGVPVDEDGHYTMYK